MYIEMMKKYVFKDITFIPARYLHMDNMVPLPYHLLHLMVHPAEYVINFNADVLFPITIRLFLDKITINSKGKQLIWYNTFLGNAPVYFHPGIFLPEFNVEYWVLDGNLNAHVRIDSNKPTYNDLSNWVQVNYAKLS